MPIVRNCKICSKEFETKNFWIKQGKGLYCSNECSYKSRRKGKDIPCYLCKKVTYKSDKSLKSSKSKKFFCSKSCQTKWRNTVFIGDKHANWKTGRYVYRSVLRRHKVPAVCRLCKTTDERVLAVHHIDHDRTNNKVVNLAWLCHNCHHLVHHHPDVRDEFMVTIV